MTVTTRTASTSDPRPLVVARPSGWVIAGGRCAECGHPIVRDTAVDAYDAAGIEPSDADVLEVHDAFTIGELVTVEALGLVAEGAAPAAVAAGGLSLGGKSPVNPSGGLLSRGHPLAATGVAQVAELVWQLRGDADQRLVAEPRIGLLETMGGGTAGIDGNACVVAVLEAGLTH